MTKNWTYDEGKWLISIYANRKEEYFQTKMKKQFWENILADLKSLNVLVSPTTAENVKMKWRCLYRAYKQAKDRGTSTKFKYMPNMDEIYHNDSAISSSFTVSVGVTNVPVHAPMHMKEQIKTNTGTNIPIEEEGNKIILKTKKKYIRKNRSVQDSKEKYYENKKRLKKEKNEILKNYIKNKEKDRGQSGKTMDVLLERLLNRFN